MTVKMPTGKPVATLPPTRQSSPEEKGTTGKSSAATSSPSRDKVELSTIAIEVSGAKGNDAVTDSKRADRVASLKQQVASGAYQPDSRKVAASLLQQVLERSRD